MVCTHDKMFRPFFSNPPPPLHLNKRLIWTQFIATRSIKGLKGQREEITSLRCLIIRCSWRQTEVRLHLCVTPAVTHALGHPGIQGYDGATWVVQVWNSPSGSIKKCHSWERSGSSQHSEYFFFSFVTPPRTFPHLSTPGTVTCHLQRGTITCPGTCMLTCLCAQCENMANNITAVEGIPFQTLDVSVGFATWTQDLRVFRGL